MLFAKKKKKKELTCIVLFCRSFTGPVEVFYRIVSNSHSFNVILICSLKFEGALAVNSLNGVDIKKFTDDAVLVDVDANITSKKMFYNIEAPSVSTHRLTCDSVYPDVIGTAAQGIRLDIDETM